MIPKILKQNKNELLNKLKTMYPYIEEVSISAFIDILQKAFLESYRNVLANSYLNEKEISDILERCMTEDVFYNLKTHKLESISETEVINSVDTDIQILNSTISIIGILGVSNQVLTINTTAMQ